MANVRSVDFLPEIFQTPVNKQFLAATLDQLIQEPKFKKSQGFIGQKVGPGVNASDQYVIEPTKSRNDYQLEPGVVQISPTDSKSIVDAITYPGMTDALKLQGAITNNSNSLYTNDYYTWDPFVDFDKFVNYAQYYWLPSGPLAVDVSATGIPLTDSFTVTRNNGFYTFSGQAGNNPVLTLLKGGTYQFNVAQNDQASIQYRVTNNGTSAWVIDYASNPTLTLVRGNTYTFNLTTNPSLAFYIKTQPSFGTTNIYSDGVINNGASSRLITFTVPQNAPDVLYYCNDLEFNLRGQFNIVDATPGTGPGFWIQIDPGVNGRIPATPNISSRDVLGVTDNGIDLGTITFAVPLSTAQNFYYNLTNYGSVDLLTSLQFNQINNVYVSDFLQTYPGGIDGITNLNGRTVVFDTTTNNGWEISSNFDPLARDDLLTGEVGSFDSTEFDQATFITDPAQRYGVWRINYATDSGGRVYLSLTSVAPIADLEKFTVLFGDQWASTQWYKDTNGYFQQIPLLTADKNLLFYQDGTDPNIFGQIRLIDQTSSATLDIANIIGQSTYASPNGVIFTNGLKVTFRGDVVPSSYQNNSYYVEGVGTAIKLLPVSDFVTPETYTQSATVPFDSLPYDNGNFDGTLNAPLIPDYLTINRASGDLNAWTRSNRWFHIDVINAAAAYNNTVPILDNNFRARRPVLEFRAGTKLFDFGTEGIQSVNIIDLQQTDALGNVNGTLGYGVDGYQLIEGSTIIFAADADLEVRNKIYQVTFITPDTVPPLIAEPILNLVQIGSVLIDNSTVCLSGETLQGVSFRYDGVIWIRAQQKISVNQPPQFDVYDANGISFSDRITYPSTDFTGSPLFSYAVGSGPADLVLGFPLTYLNLNNIGDIVFDNNLYADSFNYTIDNVGQVLPLSTGFVRQYSNRILYQKEIGWQTAITKSLIRQQFQFVYDGNPVQLDVAVNNNTTVPAVQIFINATFQESYNYTVTTSSNTTTITWLSTYNLGDTIEILVLSDQTSTIGFYEVPINLENNPLNNNSNKLTLGTIRNHYSTIAQNLIPLSGPVIGANNTRDLGNIVPYGLQLLQQSSPLTLTGYFMRDPKYDIFASLDYNNQEYIKFKSLLLNTVISNEYDDMTPSQILDSAIAQITTGKTNLNPFYWSDMLPAGTVFTSTSTVINPITTSVFNTVQTYNFTTSNYLGLLVYVNGRPLTRGYEYIVSVDSPVLTIIIPLAVGDTVTINEYNNTAGNFVPNTPTKLGLYPKFHPEFFVDTNYSAPTPVIQGHDGSITVAFGDIRDQVLLEFEIRIYNNLKNDGNPIPLTVDEVIPGYFRTTDYTQSEITQILGESFLNWAGLNKLDYKTQSYNSANPFTYNYSSSGNRLDGAPLLGAWRGIYRYFYDTTSPNLTPWEMVGLSEKPTWWTDRYGPVPYTSDNLVLWGDLELGLVADPVAPYIDPRYVRPGLTNVIPVDSQGQLLPPLYSVVGQNDPNAFRKSWVVGDGGPTEAAWWSSSSYPFAIMRLLVLTRPAEFFSLFADRDLYRYSAEFDQYLFNGRYRINANKLAPLYGSGVSKASYINWIIDYNQQLGVNSASALSEDLLNLDVRLCYRMAAFTDKQYAKIYLEKSSPDSQNASLLLPPESWNLLLYKNQPFENIIYSSIIIEQMETGFSVYGYSNTQPYFPILASSTNGLTQTVTAGGTAVTVPAQYTNNVVEIAYGYNFANTTIVVDFILSYGALLAAQGLVFDNVENGYVLNWAQMAQEFLYWSQQGWAPGTIININPAANKLSAYRPGEIVDSIQSYSPENMLLDQNKQTLETRNLIIERNGDAFSVISPTNQTISFLQLKFTNYENMAVLDNVSIFNDLIYDPTTAERQNRVAWQASISSDWNGLLNAQGFILNQNNVVAWIPNTKYTKGDIVIHKNSYWQAATIIQPTATFDYANWYKSNYNLIGQGLLPNIPNKANQQANSYNVYTANLESDNDLLAYGLIGFRPRQYMVDLNLDDVSQIQLYQNFIGSKGTLKSAELFTQADLGKETGQYSIFENWAVLVGTYGANANRSFFELQLNEALLNANPSTIQIIQPGKTSQADQVVYLNNLWSESYKIPSTNILTTTYSKNLDTALPSAGYVNLNDADITVFNLNDPSNINANINIVGDGTVIWVAQTNSYDWNIYRCTQTPGRLLQINNNLNATSVAQFSGVHKLSVGDLIIIKYFNSLVDGVYRVISVPSPTSVVIGYTFTNTNTNQLVGNGLVFYLQSMRVSQASDVINLPYAKSLLPGARVWVDNDGSDHWEVIEKQNPFGVIESLSPFVLINNSLFGTSISQSKNLYSVLVGAPGISSGTGGVYTYRREESRSYIENILVTLSATDAAGYGNSVDFGNQLWAVAGASASNSGAGYATVLFQQQGTNNFTQTQLLVAPDQDFSAIGFGSAVKMSDDERWMYISAPGGNKVYSYGKVDVPTQSVSYVTNGTTSAFNWVNSIQADPTYPDQFIVVVGNLIATYDVDYFLNSNVVQFYSPPIAGQQLIILRRSSITFYGDSSTTVYSLNDYLYTATNIYAATIVVDGVLQRPYIDYTFAANQITFTSAPALNANIVVTASTYWQYISTITHSVPMGAVFGSSIAMSTDGKQLLVGAVNDTAGSTVDAGSVYAYDRSAVNYLIANTAQTTYAIPGSVTAPVAVLLNNIYLTNTAQYVNGQYTVSGSNIILSADVVLTIGDTLTIETNQFQLIEKIIADAPESGSSYGYAVAICPNNCSVYVGAPLSSLAGPAPSGAVERLVNQSRIYGVTTSTIANPSLTAGYTIRINDIEVAVPTVPNNNVAGLVAAINSSGIPNVAAATTPDVTFVGDGVTQLFYIGSTYSAADSYTTMVYVNSVLQTQGVDYTYNNTTQQIIFVTAPSSKSTILVLSGRMTLSVINANAAVEFNKLSVLPGLINSTFESIGFNTYVWTQDILSPLPDDYAYFGSSLSVNSGAVNLVVGAPNGSVYEQNIFDNGNTYFDEHSTTFFNPIVNSGVAYSYDYLPSANSSLSNPGMFVFGQQLYNSASATGDQFGTAINYREGRLIIGEPRIDLAVNNANYGQAIIFDNPKNLPSWTVIYYQQPAVDVSLLDSVYSYDKLISGTQTYYDFIDPLQGKILGVARRNINYIGAVDPANYNQGSVHNIGNSWSSAHVGEIWWDTNRVRFIDPNQDDIVYASRRWGQVFPGSNVDVYQWIESSVPPTSYTGPGVPLSTISYTSATILDNNGIFSTSYYFWVRGLTTINNAAGKTLSTTGIASYIQNPRSSGIPYIAAINTNTIAIFNAINLISAQDTILHVGYDRQPTTSDIHVEYTFIADGRADNFLNDSLYRKLQDSFCGTDLAGNLVPDPLLSPGEQYGVQFRPRQSMFSNRFMALQNYLSRANTVLAQFPISETRSFNLLNSAEPIPAAGSEAWDLQVPNLEVLGYQNIVQVPLGYLYLVDSDSSQHGLWTIYEVVEGLLGRPMLNLVRIQNYDTKMYWSYINWYLPGYNSTIQPVATVSNYSGLSTLSLTTAPVGSSVKVSANGQGKWEIYLRTDMGWQRVGLEDGTISFDQTLWNYSIGRYGFDSEVFDAQYFDQEPVIETRQIIRAINEELFIDELLIERNQALILMFNYIYSEFTAPNWLMKTSFVDVDHKIRALLPYQIYQQDNQTFVLDYIQEVKPYHTQILAFNLIYNGEDLYQGSLIDFDVPAYYKTYDIEIPQFVSPILTPYTLSSSQTESSVSNTAPNDQIWLTDPWANWFNNYLLGIQSVTVADGGVGYTEPPLVTVTGTCITPASMTAIVNSAGQVVAIDIVNPGSGYSTTAIITLTGGNGAGAVAVANMGNNLVRSIRTVMKYDRYEYNTNVVTWQPNVIYNEGTLVRYANIVWSAPTTIVSSTFVPTEWVRVDAGTLSGVDRTMGYYTPTPNEPGLSLPLLINGVAYPGVQVTAPTFTQNTGFDVGNFDINPFDNISYDAAGRPTYDPAILDAAYSSSYLDSYLGTRPTDINVDGGAYVDTYSSHAPEELVPGAEFDTLDFRVYTTPGSDWTGRGHGMPIAGRRYTYDPENPVAYFGDLLPFPMVILTWNITTELGVEPSAYDWVNYNFTLTQGASAGDTIQIAVVATGGGNQLLSSTYVGSDISDTISIPFPYSSISQFVIYDGEFGPLVEGVDYTYAFETENTTRITFEYTFGATDRINLTCLGYAATGTTHSWSLPVFETITITDSSVLDYPLVNSLQGTNPANIIVTRNGLRAIPSEGIRYVSNGVQTVYELPTRGGYNQALIADNDVAVYIGNQPLILGIDFFVDPVIGSLPRTITLVTPANTGAIVLISVRTAAQYWVVGDQLQFRSGAGLSPQIGDIIEIITWNDTSEQGLLTQVFVGPTLVGAIEYQGYDTTLFDPGSVTVPVPTGWFDYSTGVQQQFNIFDIGRVINDPERLLVSLNGKWLFNGIGYTINGTNLVIQGPPIDTSAVLVITSFTEFVVPAAMAFRIFQDMRGAQLTYRITAKTTTTVTNAVSAEADIIYVADTAALDLPDLATNMWGVVTINGERIMYRQLDSNDNTISSLRRGTGGTAAAAHPAGSQVYNFGPGNLLPAQYQNYIVNNNTLANGTTTTFVANNIDVGDSDEVEVYVGGILQTSGYSIISINPVTVEFDTAPINGYEVTILVRRGVTWYAPGDGTPSNGVPLQETETIAARFLRGL